MPFACVRKGVERPLLLVLRWFAFVVVTDIPVSVAKLGHLGRRVRVNTVLGVALQEELALGPMLEL